MLKQPDKQKQASLLTRSPDAELVWDQMYAELTTDAGGMLGAMTARGAAQVMRLASLYSLLDRTTTITVDHLHAAAAVWRYCVASAAYCFGDGIGDPTADRILRALQGEPAGLTRTDIRDLFQRHKGVVEIDDALALLEDAGLAERASQAGAGRPEERWFALSVPQRLVSP